MPIQVRRHAIPARTPAPVRSLNSCWQPSLPVRPPCETGRPPSAAAVERAGAAHSLHRTASDAMSQCQGSPCDLDRVRAAVRITSSPSASSKTQTAGQGRPTGEACAFAYTRVYRGRRTQSPRHAFCLPPPKPCPVAALPRVNGGRKYERLTCVIPGLCRVVLARTRMRCAATVWLRCAHLRPGDSAPFT